MSYQDTHGNTLLLKEQDLFGDRKYWSRPPKGHFKRDPAADYSGDTTDTDIGIGNGGSRRSRRPSRKYKKSAKRVFRKKSRSTRRR